ncbi:MAG: TonB family protein [Elusimicrobiota bacterium]
MTLDGSMKPYLALSAMGHGALVVLVGMLSSGPSGPGKVYRIDFIGPTSGILNRDQGGGPAPAVQAPPAAASPAKRPPPQTDPDAFGRRKPGAPLPRPSFLEGPAAKTTAEPPPVAAPAQPAAASGGAGEEGGTGMGSGPAGALVSADIGDFPYPWFITQVRTSLWQKWSERMPSEPGECTVVFTILRNGKAVDVRVELTSGEKGFDYVATSAVREAAPFPPLPTGFSEPFLRVHVQFMTQR